MRRLRYYCGTALLGMLILLWNGCGQKTKDVDTFLQSDVSGNDMETVTEEPKGTDRNADEETDPQENESRIREQRETADAEETIAGEGNRSETGKGNGEESENGAVKKEPVKVRGIYVSGPIAGHARMEELISLVEETELNAMVIDVKNDDGRITYKMQSDTVLEIGAGIGYIQDIDALVKKCKEKDIYLIARIVAFRDPYLAEQKPELAVKTLTGEIFRDKNGLAWVNPYKKEVWDYLMEVAEGAIESGFDEIQFDYIRFSTDIKAGETTFGPEAEGISKIEIITQFTEYAYETLSPLGVFVAADVFGTVIDNETDQAIVGQDYGQMARHLDYICPMVYPSHYVNGAYGISVPDAEPYQTIFSAMSSSAETLAGIKEEKAKVRVWLQGFTASWVPGHISYGRAQIREQIKGAYDAGYEEWILWNAAVRYERDSLLTDEEAETERENWKKEKAGRECG